MNNYNYCHTITFTTYTEFSSKMNHKSEPGDCIIVIANRVMVLVATDCLVFKIRFEKSTLKRSSERIKQF